jgi:O-antigen/teichoic acid export membrane protein
MGIIIRQSIKGTIVTYIGAFIGFLTSIFVLTQFLDPEDIGLTKVIFEIGTVFGVLA